MFSTLIYGLTIGGILYIISIGLSLTFGSMRIVNFSHGMIYTTGAYLLIALLPFVKGRFVLGVLLALLAVIPLSFFIERYIIRRLYGESIDYAIIATYAVLLIGVDLIKWIWGTSPIPLSDPIGRSVTILSIDVPLYRLVIIGVSLALCGGLWLFFKKTMVGKIVIAGLQDREAVRSLGISVDRYFSIVFVIGSCLAALGGDSLCSHHDRPPLHGFSHPSHQFCRCHCGGSRKPERNYNCCLCLGDGDGHYRAFLGTGCRGNGFCRHGRRPGL